jgi:thiamine-monophosphate kinase
MKLHELGEFGMIRQIQALVDRPSHDIVFGISDDAAAVHVDGGLLSLFSTDLLIEDVHFDLRYFSFFQVGWRVAAANISDIAAMAGVPKYLLVSLALPDSCDSESVLDLYRGVTALADTYGVIVVGGDISRSSDKIFISVTVVGQVEKEKMVSRAGAIVGDALMVTGELGGSQAGLLALQPGKSALRNACPEAVARHLDPVPRVLEGRFLTENFEIHAMIDISDGLAAEVHHICDRSCVGASIRRDDIPIGAEVTRIAAELRTDALDLALAGGEDYELLFTVAEKDATAVQRDFEHRFELKCSRIGSIEKRAYGIQLLGEGGEYRSLAGAGFKHF